MKYKLCWKEREELAWCAGLADGEGHFHASKVSKYNYVNFRFEISQVNKEVLERFLKAVGGGKIYGPWKHAQGHSDFYRYVSSSTQQARKIMELLWEWLGSVKKEQAQEAWDKRVNYEKEKLVLRKASRGKLQKYKKEYAREYYQKHKDIWNNQKVVIL